MDMNWKSRNILLAAAFLFHLATTQRVCAQNFAATGSMTTARGNFVTAVLSNGKVLVAGGAANGPVSVSGAEIFDLISGTFTPTGPMTIGRADATGTPLANGATVLITGGIFYVTSSTGYSLSSAELYGCDRGVHSRRQHGEPRSNHTATLLNNGQILITGGLSNAFETSTALPSAELYNPATGTFTATGSMSTARWGHAATLLNSGKVLITGGSQSGAAFSSAELYDPITGTFTPTGNMTTVRALHTATLLNTGQVLVAGGNSQNGNPTLSSAELYDPSTGTFLATANMTVARQSHTATLLTNGQVLIAGGSSAAGTFLSSAELFGPINGNFTVFSDFGPNMTSNSSINGSGWCVTGDSAPGCGPPVDRWVASPFTPNGNFTLTQIDLALGAATTDNSAVIELMDSVDGLPGTTVLESWTDMNVPSSVVPGPSPVVTLDSAGGFTLQSGAQYWLVAKGYTGVSFAYWWGNTQGLFGSYESNDDGVSWYLISSTPGTLTTFDVLGTSSPPFAVSGSMTTARSVQGAALLNNGMVLVAGGENSTGVLSNAELYGPAQPPPTMQTMTQPLSPTAPNQFQFDNNVHNYVVQYPSGASFSNVSMSVTAAQISQASFQQRVAGTPFASALCIVYEGEAGYCEDYQVTCMVTSTGQPTPCPSQSTPTIVVKSSFDTLQPITNPGFLDHTDWNQQLDQCF